MALSIAISSQLCNHIICTNYYNKNSCLTKLTITIFYYSQYYFYAPHPICRNFHHRSSSLDIPRVNRYYIANSSHKIVALNLNNAQFVINIRIIRCLNQWDLIYDLCAKSVYMYIPYTTYICSYICILYIYTFRC